MATRKPSTRVQLKHGEAGDLDDVMRIMGRAFEPCFGEAWTRSQCAGILPLGGVGLTLATDESGTLGFALVRRVADEAELLLLAVDPLRQHCGIGKLLLDDFVDGARAAGAVRLHLEVRDGNQAVRMYRAAGFEPVGRRRSYYHGPTGETYDAITLMLAD